LRDREQVLVEEVLVVLGAGGFQHRVGHLAPGLPQVQRLVEGVRIIDRHGGLERLAVGRHPEALHHMLLERVGGAEIVDEARLRGKPDGCRPPGLSPFS